MSMRIDKRMREIIRRDPNGSRAKRRLKYFGLQATENDSDLGLTGRRGEVVGHNQCPDHHCRSQYDEYCHTRHAGHRRPPAECRRKDGVSAPRVITMTYLTN